MRTVLLLLSLALVWGCSSGGGRGLVADTLIGVVRGGNDAEEPPQDATITRARVEELGLAMLRVRESEEAPASIYFARLGNRDFAQYVTVGPRTVTLRGSLVTATSGFGFDLLSVVAEASDPLVSYRPPEAWPGQVTRTYRVDGRGPQGREIVATCRFRTGGSQEIEILERRYDVTSVTETCRTDDGTFVNVHLVDEAGFVWVSQQPTLPGRQSMSYEVLEPLTE